MIRPIQCGTGIPACALLAGIKHPTAVQGSDIFLVSWNLNIHREHAQ
jgi:hypothetical protein